MYLPDRILGAEVLITVKTYPQPSNSYGELVCTAGFFQKKWIRLYPIPFRAMSIDKQYSKYHWIKLDLARNYKDFRIESYKPLNDVETIIIGKKLGTSNNWLERKRYALAEVFTSLNELIDLAHKEKKSLGTLKPKEVIDLKIEKLREREWKKEWRDKLLQYNLFDLDDNGEGKVRQVVRKLPYKYSYVFLSEGDKKPRTLMIEDWEIGALYWRSLKSCGGNEDEANRQVKEKYLEEFRKKDLYFFMGTTKLHHGSDSPFIIVGVFWPPKVLAEPLTLFDI